jgi:hypothetical protein
MPEGRRVEEKRRELLAYLREHPEELRPVSRKLLYDQTFEDLQSSGFWEGNGYSETIVSN